jgi:hypothetical protein
MSITSDLTMNITMVGALLMAVASTTAMFITLRTKVEDHGNRLSDHSEKIRSLEKLGANTDIQFAKIIAKLEFIEEKIRDHIHNPKGPSAT